MEAYLYHALDNEQVQCRLCGHHCIIKPGRRGICGVRQNDDGILKTLVYGRVVARHIDPIEKKPLFHFYPGSRSYSIATVGCNFKCRFCQNADIAQMPRDRDGLVMGDFVAPEDIVADAVRHHCRSIAYTYTEPTVYFEYALEIARLAKAQGIGNVFVTNGYMSAEALDMVAPYLNAANVDLKAFSDGFYHTYCGAHLEPVKETLRKMKALGILVEVTTLLIPGLNDDPEELGRLAAFICIDLGADTPWHISRFHPTHRLTDRPATPLKTLQLAGEIGRQAGLHYVYLGNVHGENGESTQCPHCSTMLIDRRGFQLVGNFITGNRCPRCQTVISGVGMSD